MTSGSLALPASNRPNNSNGHADFAPPSHPERTLRLAEATTLAVDQIGDAAAREIEKAADEIMREAEEKVAKLRELAAAIRGQTKVASEHVSEFVATSKMVVDGIHEVYAKIKRETEPARRQ